MFLATLTMITAQSQYKKKNYVECACKGGGEWYNFVVCWGTTGRLWWGPCGSSIYRNTGCGATWWGVYTWRGAVCKPIALVLFTARGLAFFIGHSRLQLRGIARLCLEVLAHWLCKDWNKKNKIYDSNSRKEFFLEHFYGLSWEKGGGEEIIKAFVSPPILSGKVIVYKWFISLPRLMHKKLFQNSFKLCRNSKLNWDCFEIVPHHHRGVVPRVLHASGLHRCAFMCSIEFEFIWAHAVRRTGKWGT